MTNEEVDKIAKAAVSAIVRDMTSRRALRQSWESIDEDIREEIEYEWANMVAMAFGKHRSKL